MDEMQPHGPEKDKLCLEYVPLDTVLLWEDNHKRHDIGGLISSFKKHGFKDPMKFEPELNDGSGGFVEGNGRCLALTAMARDGGDPPRGILIGEDGAWLVPVLFGVDATSEAAAEAYGIDHNAITMRGGDYDLTDHLRMWDDGFVAQLAELAGRKNLPAAFDAEDVDALLYVEQNPLPDNEDDRDSPGSVLVRFSDAKQWRRVRTLLDPHIVSGDRRCEVDNEFFYDMVTAQLT